jgi:hypothetical protein
MNLFVYAMLPAVGGAFEKFVKPESKTVRLAPKRVGRPQKKVNPETRRRPLKSTGHN